jgi:hypothetical protein
MDSIDNKMKYVNLKEIYFTALKLRNSEILN